MTVRDLKRHLTTLDEDLLVCIIHPNKFPSTPIIREDTVVHPPAFRPAKVKKDDTVITIE